VSLVWFEGHIYDDEPLPIDPGDRGLLLGDGIFETLLVVGHTALWRAEHLARLENAARKLVLRLNLEVVGQAIKELLELAHETHVLRVTLSRGAGVRGLAGQGIKPTILVSLDSFDPKMIFQPVKLITSSIRRSTSSVAARTKTLSYLDNVMAAREATAQHAEDALLLNTDGFAASSTISNLFLLKSDQLITPSLDQAILPGIMRRALLDEAASLGFAPVERPVEPAELLTADAVFLTNSLRFIRPVTAIDELPMRSRNLDSFINCLCKLAKQQCGTDLRLI